MALASKQTTRVDIPHEENQWMDLRRLSWRQLEAASDAVTDANLERIKRLGGDLLRAMQGAASGQQQAPESAYDRAAVLGAGIVRWSYDVPVSPQAIDDLDEATAAWAVHEILALGKLRTEEQQKNA